MPRASIVSASELLPNFRHLFFEHGTVIGDPRLKGGIEASGPNHVSMPGYLELLTGATTPCRSNDCGLKPTSTLLDELDDRPRGRPDAIAAFTSWEALGAIAAGDATRSFIRAGRGEGEDEPPYPGSGKYRPDRVTEALAVAHLLADRPRFVWIGLGDTDEWAHRHDYRGYLDALRSADAFLGELAAHFGEMGDYGARTALFVTTDHGRDGNFADHGGPASTRVWLAAHGASIAESGAIATPEVRHLRDVTPTIRTLLGYPARACDGCGSAMKELMRLRTGVL
jgi:hypothetical protein